MGLLKGRREVKKNQTSSTKVSWLGAQACYVSLYPYTY